MTEPGDGAGFAGAVERLWADGGLRVRFGASARRYAERFLGSAAVLRRFEVQLGDIRQAQPVADEEMELLPEHDGRGLPGPGPGGSV